MMGYCWWAEWQDARADCYHPDCPALAPWVIYEEQAGRSPAESTWHACPAHLATWRATMAADPSMRWMERGSAPTP